MIKLNLSRVEMNEAEFALAMKTFPCLKRLAVTACPNTVVSIDSIPLSVKSLALNVKGVWI